jgi:aminoglycoside phosphotransferase (APT) family kinase protein
MSDTLDPATIAELVRVSLPDRQDRPRLTPINTGKHNRSYWVDFAEARFVLRVAPADDAGFVFYERLMMRQEPDLHALIRSHTTIPAADVVGADFSRRNIDRDAVLMTALPGRPLSDVPPKSDSWRAGILRQVGDALRQLHALTADTCLGVRAYGYLGAHRPMPPQPAWEPAFALMWNMLLDDVAACGCYTQEETQAWRDLFERHRSHFTHPVEPRLLHMDVWSQNILVDDAGAMTGLVDFDRALWGDPEIEFAVLDYCGISEPAFWTGYGARRDTSPAAQIRQRFYLLYEMQKYMPISVWRRQDWNAAMAYKAKCLAVAELGLPSA